MKLITTMLDRTDYLITLEDRRFWDIALYRMALYRRFRELDASLCKGLKL